MEKARKWKRVIAILLTVTMIFQNGASVTASGDLHMVPETNVESEAAAQAAAESEAKAKAESEAAAQAAAESEAQAKAESEAAAKAAAESEAQAKAESEAAAKAESEAAAQVAAESEAQAKAESEAAAKAAAESEAKAKAESESQAAAESEAAKAESESQAKETETTKPEESETAAPTEKETEAPTEKETEKESETPAPAESEATKPAESETAPVTYKVTFEQNAALHGTILVDNAAVDVSAYYKEVEQNQAFRFTVTASEGYEVEFVRLDNVDLPKTENPNEYQIPNVTKDSQVVVSYKEVPQSEAEGSDTSEETAESESEPAESETAVQNLVTFTGENVTITANGTAVTDGTAMALDGKIVFTIVPAEGFAVTEVLVDGSIPARTTGNPNEYIIEGIQTDETVVSIATETVETEAVESETVETETETEPVETETEVETESETETEVETETETEAQEITESKEANGTIVTVVYSSAAFDEPVELQVTELSRTETIIPAEESVSGQEEKQYDVAYDVSFINQEGQEVEPKEGYPVSVSMDYTFVEEEVTEMEVVHIPDNGAEEVVVDQPQGSSAEVNFTLDSFSKVAVKINTLTNNAEEKVSELAADDVITEFSVVADRQIVTVGDSINVRAIIKPDDYPNKVIEWTSNNPEIASVDENGVVTTHQVGIVEITGTSVAEPENTASVTIEVEAIKAQKIEITGYDENYLLPGDKVTLKAEVTPQDAEDKAIVWSSGNNEILEVTQKGEVTARGQGTTTIRAENIATGVYDEIEITVYDDEPYSATVQVWVTNQNQNVPITVYLPKDGTPVVIQDVIPEQISKNGSVYTFVGPIYIHNSSSGDNWGNIQNQDQAVRLRYSSDSWINKIQYSSSLSGNNWNAVRDNNIAAQYELVYSGDEESDTDVKVIVGDWPYEKGHAATDKIIQIRIYNQETDSYDYDSGYMYYDDNAGGRSGADYGKIKFDCDESRYEVVNIKIEKTEKRNGQLSIVSEAAQEPVSVNFTTRKDYERYRVTATIKAKEFTVHYDINNGTGEVPADEKIKAINGNMVTVKDSPQPTKKDYIFGGWEYNGTTYFGGESFEMPAHDVTFVAKWIPASEAIYYEVNDTSMGSVTRSYERIGENTGNVKGSIANAKPGYVFLGWIDANGSAETYIETDKQFKPEKKAGRYIAVFAAQSFTVEYYQVSYNEATDKTDRTKIGTETVSAVNLKAGDTITLTEEQLNSYQPENYGNGQYEEIQFSGDSKKDIVKVYYYPQGGTVRYNLIFEDAEWSGGTGFTGTAPILIDPDKYSYNETVTIPKSEPQKTGYTFLGWSKQVSGGPTYTDVPGGTKIPFPYGSNGKDDDTFTLDAHWVGVTAENSTWKYDGKEHQLIAKIDERVAQSCPSADYHLEYKVKGEESWSEEIPTIKDAGTKEVYVRAVSSKANYPIVYLNGDENATVSITVTKRSVTLTSGTDSKKYDGSALRKETVEVTGDGFVGDEGAAYSNFASITSVGTTPNTFDYELKEGTLEENYSITPAYGTLTISANTEDLKFVET